MGEEIAECRRKLQQERYGHREQINRFRYEFDELCHDKIERVIELIEVIHQNELKDDKAQKAQIARLKGEIKKLKESIRNIAERWTQFTNRVNESRTPMNQRVLKASTSVGGFSSPVSSVGVS